MQTIEIAAFCKNICPRLAIRIVDRAVIDRMLWCVMSFVVVVSHFRIRNSLGVAVA